MRERSEHIFELLPKENIARSIWLGAVLFVGWRRGGGGYYRARACIQIEH